MEIPQNVKINVLAVLLSNGRDKGVNLDTFCETFQKIMKEQLHYQALGYRSLMEFFQAMPDVVRYVISVHVCIQYILYTNIAAEPF